MKVGYSLNHGMEEEKRKICSAARRASNLHAGVECTENSHFLQYALNEIFEYAFVDLDIFGVLRRNSRGFIVMDIEKDISNPRFLIPFMTVSTFVMLAAAGVEGLMIILYSLWYGIVAVLALTAISHWLKSLAARFHNSAGERQRLIYTMKNTSAAVDFVGFFGRSLTYRFFKGGKR